MLVHGDSEKVSELSVLVSELSEQLEQKDQLCKYYKEELLRIQKQIPGHLEVTQQQLSLSEEEKKGE